MICRIFIYIAILSLCTKCYGQETKEITNTVGMKFVLIPKGTFTMGSPESENGRSEDELEHKVNISSDFYLGVTEVTWAQLEKGLEGVMESEKRKYRAIGDPRSSEDISNYPADGVSWRLATDFCESLSRLPEEKFLEHSYRLPTEAEWEYACRAGSKTQFSFGEDKRLLLEHAWFDVNSKRTSMAFITHRVGEKKPNAWGLFDMHGNVKEWCSDWYGKYPDSEVTDPIGETDGLNLKRPSSSKRKSKKGEDEPLKVLRGGDSGSQFNRLRSASREKADKDSRDGGFRLVLVLPKDTN